MRGWWSDRDADMNFRSLWRPSEAVLGQRGGAGRREGLSALPERTVKSSSTLVTVARAGGEALVHHRPAALSNVPEELCEINNQI